MPLRCKGLNEVNEWTVRDEARERKVSATMTRCRESGDDANKTT